MVAGIQFLFNVKSVMVGMAQLVSAPDCGSGGRGFESHYPPFLYGSLAQSVEHWTFNPGVPGSSPLEPILCDLGI